LKLKRRFWCKSTTHFLSFRIKFISNFKNSILFKCTCIEFCKCVAMLKEDSFRLTLIYLCCERWWKKWKYWKYRRKKQFFRFLIKPSKIHAHQNKLTTLHIFINLHHDKAKRYAMQLQWNEQHKRVILLSLFNWTWRMSKKERKFYCIYFSHITHHNLVRIIASFPISEIKEKISKF